LTIASANSIFAVSAKVPNMETYSAKTPFIYQRKHEWK